MIFKSAPILYSRRAQVSVYTLAKWWHVFLQQQTNKQKKQNAPNFSQKLNKFQGAEKEKKPRFCNPYLYLLKDREFHMKNHIVWI